MKKIYYLFLLVLVSCSTTEEVAEIKSTEIIITNKSEKDSVKVYLTLGANESVVGHFGIKKENTTPNNLSQGYFWAKKDSSYHSNNKGKPFLGFAIAFDTTNIPCTGAVGTRFISGVSVFEGSLNVDYESFDISVMDGINSLMKVSVNTSNWQTGEGKYTAEFKEAQNKSKLSDNCGIRGVYPYRCSGCIDTTSNPPNNCFGLKTVCNTQQICQTSRNNQIGGIINLDYLGEVRDSSLIHRTEK